jgi:hypothetical protein
MTTGVIIVIIVIAVIIVAAAGAAIARSNRQRQLRQRFGPEYDRLAAELGSRRKAEAELTGRQRRVRDLNIRPLDEAAQARYAQEWEAVQAHFVDAPQGAVLDAQRLMMTVMNERGYPTEAEDQILADLSVDHANVLDHYRVASSTAQGAEAGSAATEDLRQAMIHYRALFHDLIGESPEPDEAAIAAAAAGNGSGRFRPGATSLDGQVPADEGPVLADRTTDDTAPAEPDVAEVTPADTSTEDTAPADTAPADTAPADTVSADPDSADPDSADPDAVETAPAESEQDSTARRAG